MPSVRSYGQYCALAKALDAVGDRWTVLIVRELLARGPARYTDLLHGLPGIATNLLADRIAQLEAAGIVRREAAPPPVAASLVRLTERGEALWPVIRELGRWGGPLVAERDGGEAFRPHWLGVPAQLHLADSDPDGPPVAIELRSGDDAMVIEADAGAIRTRAGRAEAPDAVLSGAPELLAAVVAGRLGVREACARGLELAGDAGAVERLQRPPAAARA
jgi:DNA-binding HxlR family transcriptional regulator/putative sterol carrier protein